MLLLREGDLVTVRTEHRLPRPEVGTERRSRAERVVADVEIPGDGMPFPADALRTTPLPDAAGPVETSHTIVVDYWFEQARVLVPPAIPLREVRHARDIPDEAFLDAVRRARKGTLGATRWDVAAALVGLQVPFWEESPIPDKVVLAKARRLIKRGVIEGCCCGCRGDFRILAEAS